MALAKLEMLVSGSESINEAEEFGMLANVVQESLSILHQFSHSWNPRKSRLAHIALSAFQAEERNLSDEEHKLIVSGNSTTTQRISEEEIARRLGKRIGQYKRRLEELNRLNGGH